MFATTVIPTKLGTISKHLPANDAAANLPSTSILDSSLSTTATSNISTTATHNISTTATSNLSTPINSDTTPKFRSHSRNLGTSATQNPNFQNYLSLLVIPEDATINNSGSNQQQALTNNISPATVTNNELLMAIFPFDLEETIEIPLFSRAALEEKPITAMYTDAKIDGHTIKLILDIDQAASARIITANGVIKTPIGKIDNLSIKINSIMVPIKVFVIEVTQYQALVGNNWLSKTNTILDWTMQELQLSQNSQHTQALAVYDHGKEKQKEEHTWETTIGAWIDDNQNELSPTLSWEEKGKGKERENNLPEETESTKNNTSNWTSSYSIHESLPQPPHIPLKYKDCGKKLSSMGAWIAPDKNHWMRTHYYCKSCHRERYDYPKRQGKMTFLVKEECVTLHATISCLNGYPHDKDEIWWMANAKVEGTTPSKILEIKNNPPEPVNIILVLNPDAFFNIETNPKDFYKHYQNLAPIKEKQEEQLCDLIYNPPICMIYTIPEKEEPISSCASESKSPFNPNSNSDNNDDKNTTITITMIQTQIQTQILKYEQYIAISDLTKELELKWFSDNNEGIMLEHMYNTDAGFDLRYPGKNAIKLEPHSHICLDLKIALEISATTMVQLASKSSLAKREINIREGIIDMEYVENIIAMLQNDSGKAYIIDPNEKIAQTIFLPLVRVAQLVLVGKREKLGITVRGIQGFGLTDRVDVPINMAEKEIVDQEKIISMGQTISIPPYGQYIIGIKRKVKKQNQIFETEPTLCESEEIGFINFHIPAKDYSHIKIPIYNNTGNIIVIPARTTIGYLSTEIEDQPPSTISDFLQLCGYVDITSQTIYG
ncbi:hypothetical protein G9A89_013389 [Geosiphon pyriformis]|nr:hypothetical protein G9A89_013389 [Geosiphon pyriformis]